MKTVTLRQAFTLIEVLVSVLIISGSIVYALQIHSQNHAQILYISERGKTALQDSLFLTEDASRHHKDEKDAYSMIERYFRVDDLESRRVLKNISRTYNIPEPIRLNADEEGMPTATIEEVQMKDKFSSSYFHFNISGF